MKIDQILKWVATFTLIVGTFVNAGFPHLYPIGPILLVAKILALSGVVIMKPDVVQYGGGMEAAIKQSQND